MTMYSFALFSAMFFAAAGTSGDMCEVAEVDRIDCKYDESNCVANGCCWRPVEPNPSNRPWCYKKSSTPTPPPGPTPSPTPSSLESSSSAFVHLFEWSWADIAKECEEWLGPKGFTAVQVSPPNDHIQGSQWWTRYQPVTYKLVSRSGDEQAFIDMVQRCKKVGVGIYADAVINHIAAGSGTSIAGSTFGNRATPIYNQGDLHHNNGDESQNCGVTNYQDKWNVQYCDLSGLPDLCTSCDKVQQEVAAYIKHMSDIGIAGFRVDAAKHQDAGELGQMLSRVPEHLFRFHEVISGSGEAVTTNMYFDLGHVTEFDYSRKLRSNFIDDGKLHYLNNFGESWGLMPTKSAVVFLDNHDTQRGEAALFNYKKGKLYELATVFMLAHPYGYPKVMSSYYFDGHDQGPPSTPVHSGTDVRCGSPASHDSSMKRTSKTALNTSSSLDTPWVCEHRWLPVANMVAWRKSAGTNWVSNFQAPGGDTVAFCRGTSACIALNRQEQATWSVQVKFQLPAGRYCDVIQSDDTSNCPVVEVAADGSVNLNVPPLSAVALHIGKKMEGSLVV